MQPLPQSGYAVWKAQIATLIAEWKENLAREEPSTQRVFADYRMLEDARDRVAAWLRAPATTPATPVELRALADRIAACLEFGAVDRSRAAWLRKYLFARRSRGCHASLSPLEAAIIDSLAQAADE